MRFGLGRAILLRPALDLPGDVVLAAAEVAEPDRRRLEGVQPRQRRVHRVVDRRALDRRRLRHVRFPEHAAAHMAHEIERRTGDALVGAVEQRRGDRKALRMQRADHAELAVDRVRGRQQLAGRLAAQHVAPARRLDQVGRVRLAALELAQAERAGIAGQCGREIGVEPLRIDGERGRHRLHAGKCRLSIDGSRHPFKHQRSFRGCL